MMKFFFVATPGEPRCHTIDGIALQSVLLYQYVEPNYLIQEVVVAPSERVRK